MTILTTGFVVMGLVAGTVLLWRLPLVGAARGTGRVSVIVPARNEAANLTKLLASLAAQSHRPLEVLVVDDGSTDATAAVASAAGATVISAPALPAGWAGKPWACQTGVDAARGDVLLFLDADVHLACDAVDRLLGAANDGLLSVQPFHEVERPYEQFSAFPNVVSLMASGIAALRPSPHPGLAFGPCLLTTPADLQAAGGFASVAGESIEDIALARSFERVGLPVRCFGGGDTVRFRMYPQGAAALIEGWGKNLSGGARRARLLPLLGTVTWVCGAVSASIEAVSTRSVWSTVVYAMVAAQMGWMLRRVGSFRWWVAALFPIPLTGFIGLFVWSLLQRVGRRSVTWRGRQIPV